MASPFVQTPPSASGTPTPTPSAAGTTAAPAGAWGAFLGATPATATPTTATAAAAAAVQQPPPPPPTGHLRLTPHATRADVFTLQPEAKVPRLGSPAARDSPSPHSPRAVFSLSSPVATVAAAAAPASAKTPDAATTTAPTAAEPVVFTYLRDADAAAAAPVRTAPAPATAVPAPAPAPATTTAAAPSPVAELPTRTPARLHADVLAASLPVVPAATAGALARTASSGGSTGTGGSSGSAGAGSGSGSGGGAAGAAAGGSAAAGAADAAAAMNVVAMSGQRYIDITDLLTLPQSQAAHILGVPTSTLSKRWKEAVRGRKWPFRTVTRIDKEIMTLLHNIPQGATSQQLPEEVEASLALLMKRRQEELKPVIIRL